MLFSRKRNAAVHVLRRHVFSGLFPLGLVLPGLVGLGFVGQSSATASLIEQSPIDIITADVVEDPSFKPLTFNYSQSTNLIVKNINSPDVEGTIRGIPDAGSSVSYDGFTYNLLQFHFHIDSEHKINGQPFPMEMHFVNQKAGSTGTDGLLVVGRFIEVGPANLLLDPFFSGISSIPSPNDQFTLNNFDINALVPMGQPEFRYPGSLTTSPYAEGVNWNVFYGTPLYLSQAQIDEFAAAFPQGDARDVQPLNSRVVTTAAVPEVDPSAFGSSMMTLFAALALVERRRLRGCGRPIAA